MAAPRIAIVSRDPDIRLALAKAFDHAPATWEVGIYTQVPGDVDALVVGPDVEAPESAIRFDLHAPDTALHAVEQKLAARSLVLVTSPGGGAGTTTVAPHLAAAFATASTSCYVDLDVIWGARDRLDLGDDVLTWSKLAHPDDLMRAALPMAGGFRAFLSPGGGCPPPPFLLRSITDSFEHVVVDAPMGDGFDLAAPVARAGILVIAPSLPQARRGARLLEAHDGILWAVVANRLGPGSDASRTEIERTLGCRIALNLPCTAALRDAEDRGALLTHPWSRWRMGISRLARALSKL